MKFKERVEYKRNRIRTLWTYEHLSIRDIAETLNSDPEFIRKCGKISVPSVQQHLTKIKREYENNIDSDGLERYTSEFARSVEFMDGEISDITKLLNDKELKHDERIKYLTLRHRIEVEKMTLLADREIPLTVKKYKKDRQLWAKTLKPVEEEPEQINPDKALRLSNRILPKKEDG
jgi:predicted DNA-binding ArsR family transcriptional regulator